MKNVRIVGGTQFWICLWLSILVIAVFSLKGAISEVASAISQSSACNSSQPHAAPR